MSLSSSPLEEVPGGNLRYAEAKQWIVGRKCWYLLEDFNQGLSFNSAGSLVCPGICLVRFISFRPVWVESTSLPSPWCRSIVLRCCPSALFPGLFSLKLSHFADRRPPAERSG